MVYLRGALTAGAKAFMLCVEFQVQDLKLINGFTDKMVTSFLKVGQWCEMKVVNDMSSSTLCLLHS